MKHNSSSPIVYATVLLGNVIFLKFKNQRFKKKKNFPPVLLKYLEVFLLTLTAFLTCLLMHTEKMTSTLQATACQDCKEMKGICLRLATLASMD